MDFDTDIKPKLTATARWAMALLAGYLIQHGLLANSVGAAFTDAGVAAVLAGGAIVWSFIQKELQKKQVQAALDTPVLGTMTVEDAAAKLLPAILNALPQMPVAPSSVVSPAVSVETAAPGVSGSIPALSTATLPEPLTINPADPIFGSAAGGASDGDAVSPKSYVMPASTIFKPAGLP